MTREELVSILNNHQEEMTSLIKDSRCRDVVRLKAEFRTYKWCAGFGLTAVGIFAAFMRKG